MSGLRVPLSPRSSVSSRDQAVPRPNLQFSFFHFQFAILSLLALFFCSCHSSPSGQNDNQTFDSWQAPEAQAVQNSGRTLSADYVLKSLDDDYTSKDKANRPALLYTFDKDGRFKREEMSGGRTISHVEGSYVIGTQGELILYVEKVGDDQVAAARPERYQLDEQADGALKLRHASGTILTLAKR